MNSLEVFRHGVDVTAPTETPDTLGELDDWKPFEPGDALERILHHFEFVFVLAIIGFGVWARAHGALGRERAEYLRRVCFTCLLPAFLLRHIWLTQLDNQLYAVAAWSFAFHGLWCGLSIHVAHYLEPHDRQLRGWTILMSQGAMNSFLYPLLLKNKRFGEKSLACAVLWDLGGNMWICQFALFAIAAYFRPRTKGNKLELDHQDLIYDDEEGETLLSKSPDKQLAKWSSFVTDHAIAGVPSEIFIDALQQPVLGCCVFGFLLNFAGVPLPAVLDTPLWVVGEPYKLALYFLVGFYGDHRLSQSDVHGMVRALGTRYAISVTIIALVLIALPFEQVYRYTVALALLSPTSSYLIFLVGEHGYGEGLLRLTVCGTFVSTIISTLAQNLLMELFNAT